MSSAKRNNFPVKVEVQPGVMRRPLPASTTSTGRGELSAIMNELVHQVLSIMLSCCLLRRMTVAVLGAISNGGKLVLRIKVRTVVEEPNALPFAAYFHGKEVPNRPHRGRQFRRAVLEPSVAGFSSADYERSFHNACRYARIILKSLCNARCSSEVLVS